MNIDAIVNVATHLAAMATREPHRLAVAYPESPKRRGQVTYRKLTFQQLHQESDALAHGLESVGIRRGTRSALMVPPSLDFFTLTFALFKIGAVPVLIDPGMGIRNLGRCLGEAEPEAFIGIPKANLARKVLGWARKSIRIKVTTGRYLSGFALGDLRKIGEEKEPFAQAPTTSEETAAILFTSGSTGVAKGVVYTHGIFAAQVEMLRKLYGIEPGEVDLSTFPLFALFGPALGMTAIIPEMDPTRPAQVDPIKIIDAVKLFGVTNLFGSPALINRVGMFGAENGIKLPTLKRVISAGAPVPSKVVERFVAMLPEGTQVHTPYGATESLPVASIGSDSLLKETRFATDRGCGVCVGHPVKSMRVRIIAIRDEPIATWNESRCLPSGQIGEIAVSGSVVTSTYFNRPQATAMAKMLDLATGIIWHRMGDVGYLDSLGRLWFCGRKSQRVLTKRGTLFTIPCEAIFNQHPVVFRSALVGVQMGEEVKPVLCVEFNAFVRRAGVRYRQQSWESCVNEFRDIAIRYPHTRAISVFLQHAGFPVDTRHNAKIFREQLAIWGAKKLRRHRWPESREPIAPPPTFDSLLQQAEGER